MMDVIIVAIVVLGAIGLTIISPYLDPFDCEEEPEKEEPDQ